MGASNAEIAEQVPASRKLGADAAAELLEDADRLVAAKGKKRQDFDLAETDRDEAVAAMLGPTGNLRAPTAKIGRTVLVGFDEAAWAQALD